MELLATYSCIMFVANMHKKEKLAKNAHATMSMLRRP